MIYSNITTTGGEKISVNIRDGIITDIYKDTPPKGVNAVDLEGRTAFAGLIDSHVHFRQPGLTHKEDFYTGTKSAVAGGITLVMDMPNTLPAVTTKALFKEKQKTLKGSAFCDYGLYFGGSKNNNSAEVKTVTSEGLSPYLKIFMNVSTGEMLVENDDILDQLFAAGDKIFVHAENEMVQKALMLSRKHKKQLTICHISKKTELEAVIKEKIWRKSNSDYPPVYAEVTPHHLTFDDSIIKDNAENAMLYRAKPELSKKSDVEALWQGIKDGYIDTIGTDHAPHLLSEKLEKLTFGMPSVQHSLGVMLTHFKEKQLPLSLLEKLMCKNPAAMLGLSSYGEIAVGNRGNLTIIDIDKQWVPNRDDVISKAGWSPYEGIKLTGKTFMTIIGGQVVYNNGEFINNRVGAEI